MERRELVREVLARVTKRLDGPKPPATSEDLLRHVIDGGIASDQAREVWDMPLLEVLGAFTVADLMALILQAGEG